MGRGPGLYGAGGGLGSPGREREMPVHFSLLSPPLRPCGRFIVFSLPIFFQLPTSSPFFRPRFPVSNSNFSLKPQLLRLLSPMSGRRLHTPATLNSLFHVRSPIFPLSRIPFWSDGSQKAFLLHLPAASTCPQSSAQIKSATPTLRTTARRGTPLVPKWCLRICSLFLSSLVF